jgi:hypothetical protein
MPLGSAKSMHYQLFEDWTVFNIIAHAQPQPYLVCGKMIDRLFVLNCLHGW